MSFLLGGLITTTILIKPINKFNGKNYLVPDAIRYFFFGIIGCVIGTGFRGISSYLSNEIVISFFSVICFAIICQYFNYLVFRKIGGYDKVTSFFSGTPGGLLESINSGEKYGGDERIITIQHFLRIIIVVLLVPLFFIVFFETPKIFEEEISLKTPINYNLELLFLTTLTGLILGYRTSIPAKYFICPLILSACLNVSGTVNFSSPDWLLFISQLIVGIALGAKLLGIDANLIKKCLLLSMISTFAMLVTAFLLSVLLIGFLKIPQEILFIALVPGGVTEMSLMAVMLSSDATFVTIHHIWRILVIVIEILILNRFGTFKRLSTHMQKNN